MHINPYATWSNSDVRRAVPGVPSIHGALPFAADPSHSNLIFYFTAFKPTILNCTVIGRNTYPYFKITTDASLPGYSAVKNSDAKVIALIEWKDRPLQRVSDWLTLSPDASHRLMKMNGQQYIWAPQKGTICVRDDGIVSLEFTSSAVAAGLLEMCVVATVLLQCGHKID
ncbi:hypothetical protein B0H17DRAFT_1164041 [Mycena rosella]|uniref:Uncharacterized protein n=1 Tax=Mycena rosella TaxID=1033263 RepID=A0AAD7FTY3_MYCRO|nr:hypothetical protein B0H17DRAFT_1164041 [Mycena rosella]